MGRIENVEIFEDSMRMMRNHPRLRSAIEESIREQEFISEQNEVPSCIGNGEKTVKVVVSQKRSFEAASVYAKTMKTAVLNFASATNPGGGVVNGSSAQEEAICRCSTLYPCLNTRMMWNCFYGPHRAARHPLHNDDIIYTPKVVVFKSDTTYPKALSEDAWYEVDVISCAAPNLRKRPSNRMNSGDGDRKVDISAAELKRLHVWRLTRILDVAVQKGVEAIILGAFGCGAFRNDPEVVASAALEVIPNYVGEFKVIEFAVYCRPDDLSNYYAFRRLHG